MPETAKSPKIEAFKRDKQLEIAMSGDWLLGVNLPSIKLQLDQIETDQTIQHLVFLTRALGAWDSLLITDLIKLIDCAEKRGVAVDKTTLPKPIQGLLALVYAVPERADARRNGEKLPWFTALNNAIENRSCTAKKY